MSKSWLHKRLCRILIAFLSNKAALRQGKSGCISKRSGYLESFNTRIRCFIQPCFLQALGLRRPPQIVLPLTWLIPINRLFFLPAASQALEPEPWGPTYPSAPGSRRSATSTSTNPDRKCCFRKNTESSNMLATRGSCLWQEKAEPWD